MTFIQRRNNVDVDAGVDLTAIFWGALAVQSLQKILRTALFYRLGFLSVKISPKLTRKVAIIQTYASQLDQRQINALERSIHLDVTPNITTYFI